MAYISDTEKGYQVTLQWQGFDEFQELLEEIEDIFGEKAEELAFIFSQVDRPKALDNPKFNLDGTVILKTYSHDKISQEEIVVSKQVYKELCLIECANLLDQDYINSPRQYRIIFGPWYQ